MGKIGSCSGGKAKLSKSWIQFSADGWGCDPSLSFGLWQNYGRANGSNGDPLQKDLCQQAPRTAVVSVPDSAAGHCQPMLPPETPGHSQASLLDWEKIKPVNPKGNQPWIFIHWKDWCRSGSSNIWPPDEKSWLIRKDLDVGKDWRQEKKGKTEDKMVGCHHWLNGHEFEQALGDGGLGSLACCSPWGHKEIDTTERLNNNKTYQIQMHRLKSIPFLITLKIKFRYILRQNLGMLTIEIRCIFPAFWRHEGGKKVFQ